MKNLWDKIWMDYNGLGETLEEFLNIIPQSPEFYKQKVRIKKLYELLKKKITDYDAYVTPVAELPVKFPESFNKDEFITAWQYWKEYLEEQHALKMKSRMEIKSVARLIKLAEGDHKKAMDYLDHAIATGYRNFFKVTENVMKPEKHLNYDPDFN